MDSSIDVPGAMALIAAGRQADGSIACTVPDGWLQGRTCYGGLSSAIAYQAARQAAGDTAPPLRSAQLSFIGPVSNELTASASVLRRGKSSAYVEVKVVSGGELAILATFLFLADRQSPLAIAAPAAPEAPRPEEAEVAMRGKGSAYTRQLEYRHAMGKDGRGKPELRRWAKINDRAGLDPVTELLLIGDALPPGVAPVITGPFTASSANWTIHLHGSDIAVHDGWWLVGTRAESATGGISSQQMMVWNREGEAVMSSSQTVSFFIQQD